MFIIDQVPHSLWGIAQSESSVLLVMFELYLLYLLYLQYQKLLNCHSFTDFSCEWTSSSPLHKVNTSARWSVFTIHHSHSFKLQLIFMLILLFWANVKSGKSCRKDKSPRLIVKAIWRSARWSVKAAYFKNSSSLLEAEFDQAWFTIEYHGLALHLLSLVVRTWEVSDKMLSPAYIRIRTS